MFLKFREGNYYTAQSKKMLLITDLYLQNVFYMGKNLPMVNLAFPSKQGFKRQMNA